MGWNDHLNDITKIEELFCPHCKTTIRFWKEKQKPGFRVKDILYCPACGKKVSESMEEEYHYERTE